MAISKSPEKIVAEVEADIKNGVQMNVTSPLTKAPGEQKADEREVTNTHLGKEIKFIVVDN